MGEYVKIDALGEDALFPAYMAAPAGDVRAAIIVIPEIFGVNAGIRQKCDLLAEAGYLAVAPDIFWRFAPGVELNPDVEAELQEAFGYYGVMIDQMLHESHAIANPLMLHIPTADHLVGPEAQAAIHAGLGNHPKVTLHDYDGLDHGFAAQMGNRRNAEGAELADARTAAFFAKHLG